MPEHCKVDGDAVASYRNYYILEKKDLRLGKVQQKYQNGTKKVKFMATKKNNTSRPKIYERNPNTGVIRWRYVDESRQVWLAKLW